MIVPSAPHRDISVRNPRTGKNDFAFVSPTLSEIEAVVAALRKAQPQWRSLGAEGRCAAFEEWQARLQENSSALIAALSADTGRKMLAHMEFVGLMQTLKRWREMAQTLLAEDTRPSTEHDTIELQNRRDPFPVVGIISPWNFPLLLSFLDTAPALMAGCAACIKPSEVTLRFIEPLVATIEKVADLRPILKIVPGDGETGAALVPLVDVVAFTGSVATGRKVNEAAAHAFIPAFLELGGKDPAIVLADADIEKATTALLRGSSSATGQACQSIERIYVDRSIFDNFVERLVAKANAVSLSYPDPDAGQIGPLIFERQALTIDGHLKDAVEKGAKILTGGEIMDHDGGTWIRPTVLTSVTHDMSVMKEETFGPIMPVMPFDTTDEALALANDSDYGLSGCVFSANEARAIAVAEKMEVGAVSINDASLTSKVHEMQNEPRRYSGAGPSRMGPMGLTRFLQWKGLLINRGTPAPIELFSEGGPIRK